MARKGTCCEGLAASPHLAPIAHGLLIADAHGARLVSVLQQVLHLAPQPRGLLWCQRSQLLLFVVCNQTHPGVRAHVELST